jgi:hypothetical protein
MLRRHRSLEGLLCNPMRNMMRFFSACPCNGVPVELNWQGKTEVLGEKPVPVPFCSPQIPHGPTRDRTRASAVRGRQLTAWAMTRPFKRNANPDNLKPATTTFHSHNTIPKKLILILSFYIVLSLPQVDVLKQDFPHAQSTYYRQIYLQLGIRQDSED